MERRLAAILAADVVGYSSLMAADEARTLTVLKAHRAEIFDPLTRAHGGRIVKLMGDGVLVEFPSVVKAVECALAIQRKLTQSSGPITLRIGINLGDVLIDGDDIYGDGVNVAARLEALAAPGGIAISSIVHDSLGGRPDVGFTDCGELKVKNIDRPIRVWTWPTGGEAGRASPAMPPAAGSGKIALAITGLESLPDDPQTRQLAEALTRDLAVELGRFTQFETVLRPRASEQAGAAADYRLSGTVRMLNDYIRISVQLSDSQDEKQVWSQRYDGRLADVLEFLDETTQRVCGQLFLPLMKHATARARAKPLDGTSVYDNYLKSFHHIERPTKGGMEEARAACHTVLEIDPGFALIYEHLAWINIHAANAGWVEDPVAALREARRDAVRGIALDDQEAYLRCALGFVEAMLGNPDKGVRESRLAMELNPNDVEQAAFLAASLTFAGALDEALATFEVAEGLSPRYPPTLIFRGLALFAANRPEEAAGSLEQAVLALPGYPFGLALLAASQAECGDHTSAREAVARIAELSDYMTQAYLKALFSALEPATTDRLMVALDASGMPTG